MEFIIALALGAAAGAGVMYVKNSSKTKASRTDDETMDLEDDLEDERVKVSKQEREIDRLKQLVNEYKDALQACELELKNWKNKD